MKKKYVLFFSFVLFILFIGSSYSSWSYSINITNIISTYEFSAKINIKDLDIINKKLDKDKTCEFEIPLLKNKDTFEIENTGTIPIYIKKIEVWYEGSNKEIINQISYSGLATFSGLDFSNKKLEVSIEKGNFKREDFYIEPIDSKEASKEEIEATTKNKLSKDLISYTNILDNYNKEIAQLKLQIVSNESKIEEAKKKSEKNHINDTKAAGPQNDILILEKNNADFNKRIEELESEKSRTMEAMKNDKIKIKFYFERFNR